MRNRLTLVVLMLCTLILADPRMVSAQDHVVELGLRFWKPSPELVLSTGELNGVGIDSIDLVEEFALEETSFNEFRASLGRTHKLRISHVRFEYVEDATIQRTIVFQGRTFNFGVPASTDINWNLWTFGYEWDFVSRPGGFLGIVADLHYNRLIASVDSPALTSPAVTDVKAPIPSVGIIGRGYLGEGGSVTVEFTGFNVTRDTFEGKLYNFDIYGTLHLGRNLGVHAGYRALDVHYLVDDDFGDLKMTGLYFGGALRF